MTSASPDVEVVARRYRGFAVATRGQSACFEAWSRGVADDPAMLAWLVDLPREKQQPNLVFAAARWHGVPAPGPYAALRDALLGDDGAIRGTILTRSTQTNEVGRLATLAPVLALLQEEAGRPLALLEVGASAGLCLYPDRYDYAWPPLGALSGSGGPVLTASAAGPLPVPGRPVEVAWRGGIDLAPVDVFDDRAVAWLETCVWPEQEERRARLRTAVAIARTDPPHLVPGDLFDLVHDQVLAAAGRGPVVVFHTAVALYLSRPQRETFVETMLDLVRAGACRWVSNEQQDILPSVTATATEQPDDWLSFVLGVDGQAVALTHQHGAGIRWL
ncbi:DUF2332 domain-containing protein [Microlunatus antarcticus]|uniref:DUF2332 domain-containing protein n=1 Tax=Microlunatus antarcticus TaxID=53388 RepID=A0A7W5JY76_9ACTN|nr:DUF2332 domain-containing protein [Microlunatus antarcticus]MBB3328455.1 hypothetical protein [Microlunatus antarcticus]